MHLITATYDKKYINYRGKILLQYISVETREKEE